MKIKTALIGSDMSYKNIGHLQHPVKMSIIRREEDMFGLQ
jgi:hypothetical protein